MSEQVQDPVIEATAQAFALEVEPEESWKNLGAMRGVYRGAARRVLRVALDEALTGVGTIHLQDAGGHRNAAHTLSRLCRAAGMEGDDE